MTILFKACPRCSGEVHVNSDMYGWYLECLQCGYMAEYSDELVAALTQSSQRKELAGTAVASRVDAA